MEIENLEEDVKFVKSKMEESDEKMENMTRRVEGKASRGKCE